MVYSIVGHRAEGLIEGKGAKEIRVPRLREQHLERLGNSAGIEPRSIAQYLTIPILFVIAQELLPGTPLRSLHPHVIVCLLHAQSTSNFPGSTW
jgi:hypothetical protein